jgi:thioredoxin-like negative regulator of GroEL
MRSAVSRQAEDLLVDGSIEFPLVNPDEIAGEAWAAMARQDAGAALGLWQDLRRQFPERPEGFVWPAQVLWQAGRLDEADAMAAEAFARFPSNPDVFVQYAWIAMMRERWDEALQWWSKVRESAPERLEGYLWAVRALWKAGRLDEADAIAAEAFERFPAHADVQAECAWIAVNRRDWEAALQYWRLVERSDPARGDAQHGKVQALRNLGLLDDAEATAAEAIVRHPDHIDLAIEHVWVAVVRDDWTAAAARLETARGKFADPARFTEALGWVEERVRARASGGEMPEDAAPGAAVASADISVTDLMLAFESLGERCDFGAVQRHYGVEPLGLFRFAFTRLDPLIAGLADRFDAVGTVDDTSFEMYGDETILYMRKYGLVFHTFVYEKELATPEKRAAFHEQQRRRLLFLKKKLVEDLEDPQKIYIYASDERIDEDDAARLFAALRAYGDNALLYVRPENVDHPAGSVEALGGGLYAGYFPGLANFLDGGQPPFELWRELCERTYRLAQAAGPLRLRR